MSIVTYKPYVSMYVLVWYKATVEVNVQIRACVLIEVELLFSNIQELLSRICGTFVFTITRLLLSFSLLVFAFVSNFNIRICIVEYVGACPSNDLPRGGPTRQLFKLFGVFFLFGIFDVNFFLSTPLLSSIFIIFRN